MATRSSGVPPAYVEGPLRSELLPARGTTVDTAAGPVAVFEADGVLLAVDDACVRCASSLAAGALKCSVVTCTHCGWRYDLMTGRVEGVPMLLVDVYDVMVVDGRIMVANMPAARRRR